MSEVNKIKADLKDAECCITRRDVLISQQENEIEQLQQQNRELVARNARLSSLLGKAESLTYGKLDKLSAEIHETLKGMPIQDLAEIEVTTVEGFMASVMGEFNKPPSFAITYETLRDYAAEYAANLRGGRHD